MRSLDWLGFPRPYVAPAVRTALMFEDSPARGRRRGVPLSAEEERRRLESRSGKGPLHVRHLTEESEDQAAEIAELPDAGSAPDPHVFESPAGDSAEADVAPMDESVEASGDVSEARSPQPGTFRPELQGLRAVAILMVVCYHIWFGRVSGGVDIFLLISAFLLTGSFTRKLEEGRPLRVPQYWSHTFKRLLPPSAFVVLGTLVAAFILMPVSIRDLLQQSVATVLSWQNWWLAAHSVDYYAADRSLASPLQHFWSLSIQGQIFLLWPLIFAAVGIATRRTGLPVRPMLLVVFGVITAASLTWSIYSTATDQPLAYFDTRARLWEFSLGSVLALWLPSLERRAGYRQSSDAASERNRRLRALLSWVGLLLILACGWVVDVDLAFPGWIALWPLLAASLVIAAGPTHTRWGADALLSSRPLQKLGEISFSLYIVHWPLLIFALHLRSTSRLDGIDSAAVVGVSFLLGWLITVLIDAPVRRSAWIERRPWGPPAIIVTTLALVLSTSAISQAALDHRAEEDARSVMSPGTDRGALSLIDGGDATARGPVLPHLTDIREDTQGWAGDCGTSMKGVSGDLAKFCTIIPTDAPEDGPLVVVAGNSHALQAVPMIQEAARANGWRLVSVARPACSFGAVRSIDWCGDYNQSVVAFLGSNHAAALITYASYAGIPGGDEESVSEGFEEIGRQVLDEGIPILGLRDNPRLNDDFVECAESHRDCRTSVDASLASADPTLTVASDLNSSGASARFTPIDLTPWICPRGVCVPVVGDVYTYRDDNHLTSTYSRTLGPVLEDGISRKGFSVRPDGAASPSDGGR